MLRRLIIAVFVMGLVIGLSSTAISDVSKGALNPIENQPNESHPRFGDLVDARPPQPAFKKPESALRKVEPGLSMPGTPLDYFCDVQDYTNGSPYYFWSIPDAFGDDLFNMRFTVEDGYDCTLKVAHILMYGDVMVGTPDMRIYLWDDNGFGFPGNKLDSVDIPNAAQPVAGLGYVSADFSGGNYVFSDGDEYHYGWTILPNDPADMLGMISDDASGPFAGEERASENWAGLWGTMLNDWGLDVSFFILSERCCSEIPFTDCYWQSYWGSVAYIWRAPHPVWGDVAWAQRFSVGGPETLVVVDLFIYNDDASGSSTGDPSGNNDITITIYGDDGGLPDPGNVLDAVTIGAGTYDFFPTWTTVPFGTVIDETFHIAFSTNGSTSDVPASYETCLSDDGTFGIGGSSSDWGGGTWVDMLGGWGLDCNFIFDAYLCRDEYENCSINACNNGTAYFWRLPDVYGDVAEAQKFTAIGQECRVQNIELVLYSSATSDDPALVYTHNTEISIIPDVNGLPGPYVTAADVVTLTPADYGYSGAGGSWLINIPMDAYVSGDYWVVVHSLAPNADEGIRLLSDAGGGPCLDGWAEDWGGGWWNLMSAGWGTGAEWAMAVSSEHCCIPYTGRVCTPLKEAANPDYPTIGGDQARTCATWVETSDSWADMNLAWNFEHPLYGVGFTAPVIYDDRVVCSFNAEYRVWNLDGTPLYTLIPQSGPFPAANVRCAPTITVIPGFNSGDPVMFLSGGQNNEVHCIDFNTGSFIWSRDLNTVGPAGMYGGMRWGVFTVLGNNVYWGTEDGNIVGVDITNPLVVLPGFPYASTQSTWISGATDGTQLFYAIRATAVEGDVIAIDPATGLENWKLSDNGPLQASSIFTHANGYIGDEGFTGGVSYDAGLGLVYANSRCEADYPTDGLFYRINASNGTLYGPATISNRVFYSLPVIDQNRVLQPSLTRWGGPPAGGNMFAVNKFTGGVDWATGGPSGGRYYSNAALSCEPEPTHDQLYAFGEDGFFQCIDAETGDELWRRRGWTQYATGVQGMGVALGQDGAGWPTIAMGDLWGNFYVLKKDPAKADRPRLQIQTYNPTIAVEFGGAASLVLSSPANYTNTGGADLNFLSVTADTDPFGTAVIGFVASNVDGQFMDRAASIASDLSSAAGFKILPRGGNSIVDEGSIQSIRDFSAERMTNRTAAGFPTFINGIVHPAAGDVLAVGATMDLEVDVIQSSINRGPQTFYLQICTDDPDFFLSDVTACPEQLVTLVGGCLIDTTTLEFGIGGANRQHVTNTGRLGTGDWGDGPSGFRCFLIDGDGDTYYQGSYGYWMGDSLHMATNTQDWTSGGGEADAFISLQPDPNWCDGECKPFLTSDVTLGYMTSDGGATYDPIIGNRICASWVDSVQNFDLGLGWSWTNFGAPFDNSLTMGLYTNSRTVGAVDVPELANVTVQVMEIFERNGETVYDWYLAEYFDCDAVNDTIFIDPAISTSWFFNQTTKDMAFGQIKIPFGCGYEPSINVWGTYGSSADHGFWEWNQFWDAAWSYVSSGPGIFSDGDMSAGDEEALVTLASNNFEANDTLIIGVAHFQLFNLADASIQPSPPELVALATLVNQWAGFGRGDVNNDGDINLCDIIYLAGTVNGGNGAVPFQHLSDVNNDGLIDINDVNDMIGYYFSGGPCPVGAFIF